MTTAAADTTQATTDAAAAAAAAATTDKTQTAQTTATDGQATTDKGATSDATTQAKTGDQHDQQTVKDGKPAADGTTSDTTPAPGAPAAYTLEAPEGLPKRLIEHFETTARAANLTNEQAQAAFDDSLDAFAKEDQAQRTALEAHAEIGGEHLVATEANINRVLTKFLSKEELTVFGEEMLLRGVRNNPQLALLLSRIGKGMAEDSPVSGKTTTAPASLEERWYGEGKGADAKPAKKAE